MSRPTSRASSTAPAHYSYAFYADPAMASQFDAARFGGPIGSLLAESQARILMAFAQVTPRLTALDVGTGTGRAALALAAAGARVIGVDASPEMLRVARERARVLPHAVVFTPADAHALPFQDGAFDLAVSLRVLMHTPDWRRCLAELCRVTRQRVVIDYPASLSAAALQSAARRVAAACGARVEAYRVFTDRTIRQELAGHGFEVRHIHRQFVLPIALHKRIGSRRFTESVEGALDSAGLLNLLGSPVTVLAVRCGSS